MRNAQQSKLPRIREYFIVRGFYPISLSKLMRYRFYRVGGGTRIAGFLLALSTVALLLLGVGPISYIRKLQVVNVSFWF